MDSDLRCLPGDPLELNHLWSLRPGPFGAHVTVGGVSYSISDTEAGGQVVSETGAIVPPFAIGPVFTVQGPFVLTGGVDLLDSTDPFLPPKVIASHLLVGRGRVTLELIQSFEPTGPLGSGPTTLKWRTNQLTYEFHAPTPEPTTLLLWGTGAAGLGVARWWKRRLRPSPSNESTI